MVETSTHKTINKNLQFDNKMQFRLNEIKRRKSYFITEIH